MKNMKLNPQDYRIGNLLRDGISGTLLKVIELTEENIVMRVIDRSKFPLADGWFAERIPLTAEWLKDFGIEKNELADNSRFTVYELDNFFIVEYKGKFWHLEAGSFIDNNYYEPDVCMNFVDELQSLFLDLKKRNLKI